MPICPSCGKESKWPLVRDRCRACYQRHLRALKKAGAYEYRYHRPVEERILKRTTPGWGGCIIWTGATADGYAWINIDGVGRVAHRALYEILMGKVPDGLELDHTCHTAALDCPGGKCIHRRCVNPRHLEPVTMEENKRRGRSPMAMNALKTHCPRGHEYNDDNTYRRKSSGYRECKECRRIYDQKRAPNNEHPKVGVDRPRVREERTHCRNGHPQDGSTVFIDSDGVPRCRECRRESSRRSKQRRRRKEKEAASTY